MGRFFDPQTDGPARLEFVRLGTKRFSVCRQFAYADDHHPDEAFIVPNDLAWECDLASTPTALTWVVPVLGEHFPAIVLHDALVIEPDDEPSHIGPKITREEADRIMRDAMRDLGTGWVRRWLAWTGALAGTVFSASGLSQRPRLAQVGLVVQLATILVLGLASIVDLFDLTVRLPLIGEVGVWWMGDRSWWQELLRGLVAALLIPALFSIAWWRRWRFPLIVGLVLAPLLPVLIGIAALVATYFALEWLISDRLGHRRPEPEFDTAPCSPGFSEPT
jgi:hypothetical protein